MYELKIYKDGKFEIYNKGRNKVVFSATDTRLTTKANDTYKFDDMRDLMQSVTSWVSLATYRKISKKLCAW